LKKVFAIILLVGLVVSSIGTLAVPKQPEVIDFTMNTPDIYGDVARTADSRIRLLLPPYNINMPVPAFSQNDLAWKNDLMKTENQTIGNAGCALTSSTMVAAYYGKNTNPKIFNTDMGNYACPLYWTEVANRGGSGYISGINTLINYPSLSTFFSYAQVAMEQNRPVVLGFVQTSGRTHYVLVKAVYGQGTSLMDYGCIDPNTGSYRNLVDVVGSQPLYKLVIYNR